MRKPERIYTIAEARAEYALPVGESAIRRRCQRGDLPEARKLGEVWLLTDEDIEALRRIGPKPAGRPRRPPFIFAR